MQREQLKSRLGFILISAGCAIGIGNVWKFPYITGLYGGGFFVMIYLFFLVILGIPVMTMEFALGRASKKSPVCLYQALEPKGSKWHIHGYAAMIGSFVLMAFYTVVAGWMLSYFVSTATGQFVGLDANAVADHFSKLVANPVKMSVYMAIVVIAGFGICAVGLQNGLEKVTKFMMLALLVIMLVLAINSFFMPGAKEGLSFYLIPSAERIKKIGIGTVIVGAMNQAFFTLSLGIGAMAIFGSYIGRERSLLGESVNVAALDTFVAITSGLIIFPACFSYGVEVDSGPDLIFITLPNIFNNLTLGRLWGSLFFIFMTFAAFSTVLAVFEELIACVMDLTGYSRKKVCIINAIIVLVISLPCVFGFNLLKDFHPLGANTNIMDLEDFIVSNILLPLGSAVFVLFCVCRYGFGWENFKKEANAGKGLKVANWMRGYLTFVLPVIIVILFIVGIKGIFGF